MCRGQPKMFWFIQANEQLRLAIGKNWPNKIILPCDRLNNQANQSFNNRVKIQSFFAWFWKTPVYLVQSSVFPKLHAHTVTGSNSQSLSIYKIYKNVTNRYSCLGVWLSVINVLAVCLDAQGCIDNGVYKDIFNIRLKQWMWEHHDVFFSETSQPTL